MQTAVAQTAVEAARQMNPTTAIWIIGVMVGVITTLGQVITSLVNKRSASTLQQANPLNGTLVRLNETLVKIDMRTHDSDRVLEGHTEKLIILGTTMAQLAANEAEQTKALLDLPSAIQGSLTGAATRITKHVDDSQVAIIAALDKV